MKTFNIIKKNRKYFAAELNGYKCKILIDENSENMEPGDNTIEVVDISVRSKYGTDLIFKLSASIDEQEKIGICTLKTRFYNRILVDQCHNLGGKWDADQKVWIFSGIVEDKVEMLDEKYNSKMIPVEISFIERFGSETNEPLDLIGFNIATATGRDSGARISQGISLIKGSLTSGGSIKNWCTVATELTVIRMMIPELCFNDLLTNYDDLHVVEL